MIDAHAHSYPTAKMGLQWQRTMAHDPKRSGHVDELRASMDAAGIERTIVLLWTRAGERHEQLIDDGMDDAEARSIVRREIDELNRWGCEEGARDGRIVPFVGINVRYIARDEIRGELDALVDLGARGVKLIPPSMRLYANDKLLLPLYERCEQLGLPITSQSGTGGGEPPTPGGDHFGRPRYWDDVLTTFPRLNVTLAHLGHGYEDDVVELARRHENLRTDTSLQLSGLGRPGRRSPDELVALIRRIGTDRVLFGTNYPFVDQGRYAEVLAELPLTDEERGLVGSANARRLLGG
jgi:predicted TIM-barrel fold metal-dependent hydrolase